MSMAVELLKTMGRRTLLRRLAATGMVAVPLAAGARVALASGPLAASGVASQSVGSTAPHEAPFVQSADGSDGAAGCSRAANIRLRKVTASTVSATRTERRCGVMVLSTCASLESWRNPLSSGKATDGTGKTQRTKKS